MYRCQMCGQSTKPGDPIRRVVMKTREKDYQPRKYKLPGKNKMEVRDPGGCGREIVKELAVCGVCEFRCQVGNEG